ncbi:unnamed protein product [Arabidopsis lyrata]|nr:unnamed protein product [Arabidopsis lyrata]
MAGGPVILLPSRARHGNKKVRVNWIAPMVLPGHALSVKVLGMGVK